MKKHLKRLLFGLSLPALLAALALPEEAAAIVGAPATPGSVAGVARRTTRRTVAATSAAAANNAAAASAAEASAASAQASAAAASAASAQAAPAPPPAPARPAGAPPIGTIVAALPAGCVSSPQGGVEYFNCAGVLYRPAFQGENLVYVVQ